MLNYVVDTSSLVNLRQHYPSVAFMALWNRVGTLADEGRMIAPEQVCAELSSKDDELSGWAKQHKAMFMKNSDDMVKFATSLADKYRTMRSVNTAVEKADPHVIALAYHRSRETLADKWIVVTEEGNEPGQIPKISKFYKLDRYRLVDVIVEEGWSFS